MQQTGRRWTGWCRAGDFSATKQEVIVPNVVSCVVHWHDLIGLRINARKIPALLSSLFVVQQFKLRLVQGWLLSLNTEHKA